MAKRVQWGRPEYFIQWQSYPLSENTLEPGEHLPEELITVFEKRCVDPFHTDECQERLEREGFKIASGMQQNYHDVARCSLSALPWFTIRPLWVFIPHQWRGTDSSGPWSLWSFYQITNLFNFYKNLIVIAAPTIIHNHCEPTEKKAGFNFSQSYLSLNKVFWCCRHIGQKLDPSEKSLTSCHNFGLNYRPERAAQIDGIA